MLSKSISLSRQVSLLSLKSQFVFTWCIPHLDDYGLIDRDPSVLKAMVFPMNKHIRVPDIVAFMKEAEQEELIEIFDDCLDFTGFENHQSISAEKRAKSKFKKIPLQSPLFPENPQESPAQYRLGKDKGSKDIATESVAFSLKDEIKKLEDSPRRDMNIIALYLEHRKPDLRNREQFSATLRRHLRAAKTLISFDDQQILKALGHAKREYGEMYTLETLLKLLTK